MYNNLAYFISLVGKELRMFGEKELY